MFLSKGKIEKILYLISAMMLCYCTNSFLLMRQFKWLVFFSIALVILASLLPMISNAQFPNKKIRVCNYGVKCLGLFLISLIITIIYHIILAFFLIPSKWKVWIFSILVCIIFEAIVFWIGIICVYLTSTQLGIKWRVLGVLLGFIPVANIYMLTKIIGVVSEECTFETEKNILNINRKEKRICDTKYPILLIHGVFFRDRKGFNYWGRIPKELEINGAKIYYGNHESAANIVNSAEEIANRIKSIIKESGAGKVNIIAHSKGGLDCRYAISNLGIGEYVASLTTINTPHRGCLFADYLLNKISKNVQKGIASCYNSTMKRLGDKNPDFLSAVKDLTSESCVALDKEMIIPENIYCQSIGSKLNKASNGQFPLNYSYLFAKRFDGENDGLVGENSFRFGSRYMFLTVKGDRGISHGDMIDLNRENIRGFDVREFYVKLVSDLKERGL